MTVSGQKYNGGYPVAFIPDRHRWYLGRNLGHDPLHALSADHKRKLYEVHRQLQAERVWSDDHHDLFMLRRFLKAREWDVVKAKTMWMEMLAFRKSHQADTIFTSFKFTERADVLRIYPHGLHKVDREGRPVMIYRFGCVDLDALLRTTDMQRLTLWHVHEYERVMRTVLPACSILAGRYVEKVVNLIDVAGVKFRDIGRVLDLLSIYIKVDGNNYPETLGAMVIINAPMWFSGSFAIIKRMLSAETQKKVQILGSSYQQTLFGMIAPENLMPEFGGTSYGSLADNMGPWVPILQQMEHEQIQKHAEELRLKQEEEKRKAEAVVAPATPAHTEATALSMPQPAAMAAAATGKPPLAPYASVDAPHAHAAMPHVGVKHRLSDREVEQLQPAPARTKSGQYDYFPVDQSKRSSQDGHAQLQATIPENSADMQDVVFSPGKASPSLSRAGSATLGRGGPATLQGHGRSLHSQSSIGSQGSRSSLHGSAVHSSSQIPGNAALAAPESAVHSTQQHQVTFPMLVQTSHAPAVLQPHTATEHHQQHHPRGSRQSPSVTWPSGRSSTDDLQQQAAAMQAPDWTYAQALTDRPDAPKPQPKQLAPGSYQQYRYQQSLQQQVQYSGLPNRHSAPSSTMPASADKRQQSTIGPMSHPQQGGVSSSVAAALTAAGVAPQATTASQSAMQQANASTSSQGVNSMASTALDTFASVSESAGWLSADQGSLQPGSSITSGKGSKTGILTTQRQVPHKDSDTTKGSAAAAAQQLHAKQPALMQASGQSEKQGLRRRTSSSMTGIGESSNSPLLVAASGDDAFDSIPDNVSIQSFESCRSRGSFSGMSSFSPSVSLKQPYKAGSLRASNNGRMDEVLGSVGGASHGDKVQVHEDAIPGDVDSFGADSAQVRSSGNAPQQAPDYSTHFQHAMKGQATTSMTSFAYAAATRMASVVSQLPRWLYARRGQSEYQHLGDDQHLLNPQQGQSMHKSSAGGSPPKNVGETRRLLPDVGKTSSRRASREEQIKTDTDAALPDGQQEGATAASDGDAYHRDHEGPDMQGRQTGVSLTGWNVAAAQPTSSPMTSDAAAGAHIILNSAVLDGHQQQQPPGSPMFQNAAVILPAGLTLQGVAGVTSGQILLPPGSMGGNADGTGATQPVVIQAPIIMLDGTVPPQGAAGPRSYAQMVPEYVRAWLRNAADTIQRPPSSAKQRLLDKSATGGGSELLSDDEIFTAAGSSYGTLNRGSFDRSARAGRNAHSKSRLIDGEVASSQALSDMPLPAPGESSANDAGGTVDDERTSIPFPEPVARGPSPTVTLDGQVSSVSFQAGVPLRTLHPARDRSPYDDDGFDAGDYIPSDAPMWSQQPQHADQMARSDDAQRMKHKEQRSSRSRSGNTPGVSRAQQPVYVDSDHEEEGGLLRRNQQRPLPKYSLARRIARKLCCCM